MADNTGAPWAPLMVNATVLLTPAAVTTEMLRVWGAAEGSTVNVALICEALTRVTLLAVRLAPPVDTVAPAVKLVPVMVTCAAVPGDALAGETEDRVGAPGLTVKETALLVPAEVVTTML